MRNIKKILTYLLVLTCVICVNFTVFADESSDTSINSLNAVPTKPVGEYHVTDLGEVLSTLTIDEITDKNTDDLSGKGEVVVVTVPSLTGMDLKTFTEQLYSQWQIGGEEQNGALLVMDIGGENYHSYVGTGFGSTFTSNSIRQILDTGVEAYFDSGDYNTAATNFATSITNTVNLVSTEGTTSTPATTETAETETSFWGVLWSIVQVILIILVVIIILVVGFIFYMSYKAQKEREANPHKRQPRPRGERSSTKTSSNGSRRPRTQQKRRPTQGKEDNHTTHEPAVSEEHEESDYVVSSEQGIKEVHRSSKGRIIIEEANLHNDIRNSRKNNIPEDSNISFEDIDS